MREGKEDEGAEIESRKEAKDVGDGKEATASGKEGEESGKAPGCWAWRGIEEDG